MKEDAFPATLGQQQKRRRCKRRNAAATQGQNTEHSLALEAQRLVEANQQLEQDIAMMRLQMRSLRQQHRRELQRCQFECFDEREVDELVDQLAKVLEAPRRA
jgi:selenocysteine-specific translation elongation factor